MAEVSRFIIHELIKGEEKPKLAKALLSVENELVIKLANNVVNIYQKKTGVIWGKFREQGAFPLELIKYNKDKAMEDKEFLSLTTFAMEQLVASMKSTSGTGGYICFIEYLVGDKKFLLISMIKNTDGFKLNNLIPEEDFHVDISKLYQAININVDAYFASIGDESSKSYLGFISKKGEPSSYFNEAFSSTNNVTPSKAVAKSPQALTTFLSQYVDDKAIVKSARSSLIKYFSDNINKQVSLSKINDIANASLPNDDNKDGFIEFAKSDAWQIPDFFQAHKGAVNTLAKLTFSTDDIMLNFSKNLLGLKGKMSDRQKPIIYDQDNNSVIVSKLDPDFVKLIKAELNISDE